jgi:hypothetical protein
VSAGQGYHSHLKITNKVHHLLEAKLKELSDVMIDEPKCADILVNNLPYRFDVEYMRAKGFTFTTEPFMRLLIRAYVRYTIS